MITDLNDLEQKITDYEEGTLTLDDEYELFEYLGLSGVLSSLQGSYQRHYNDLLSAGLIQGQGPFQASSTERHARKG